MLDTLSNTFEADAIVSIRHQPRLRFEIEILGFTNVDALELWNQARVTITFCKRNVSSEAYVTRLGEKEGTFHLITLPNPLPIVTGPSQALSAVLFHVISFYDFIAPTDLRIKDNMGFHRSGRAIMEVDEWRVVVDAVEGIKGVSESLQRNGGYAITHNGKLMAHDVVPIRQIRQKTYLRLCTIFFHFVVVPGWMSCCLWVLIQPAKCVGNNGEKGR